MLRPFLFQITLSDVFIKEKQQQKKKILQSNHAVIADLKCGSSCRLWRFEPLSHLGVKTARCLL